MVSGLNQGSRTALLIPLCISHLSRQGNKTGVPDSLAVCYAFIPTTQGKSASGQFTVPAGYHAIVEDLEAYNPAAITAKRETATVVNHGRP